MMMPRSPSSGSLVDMAKAWRRFRLNVAMRLSSMTCRNSPSGCGPFLPSVRAATPPPAVFTAMCKPPSASTASASTRSTASSSVTSTAWNVPSRPEATSAPADVGRSTIATDAPRLCRSSADARAMPEAPPTMMAFLPSISTPAPSLGWAPPTSPCTEPGSMTSAPQSPDGYPPRAVASR